MVKYTRLTWKVGHQTHQTLLYGAVDDERFNREMAALQRRAEMLVEWKKPDEMKLFIDNEGDAYPIIGGKIRWDYWRRPVEN